jgi:hypothetical protein
MSHDRPLESHIARALTKRTGIALSTTVRASAQILPEEAYGGEGARNALERLAWCLVGEYK